MSLSPPLPPLSPSPPPFPARPRLADHILARRHRADGREIVVLHDTKTGRLVQLGLREWGLLAAADGTRDISGIVMAASRASAHARAEALRAFLEQLHAANMLADGVASEAPGSADLALDSSAERRPIDALEGYSLTCDGRGSCCRIYASVLFAPLEAARARAAVPGVFDGGARHRNVFMPERGSGPTAGSAVALVDGRCAYLAADGCCQIHSALGADAKPLGCRLFPVTFTDDGEAVRVSVAAECACVFESVDRPGGSNLVPVGARLRGDLDPSVFVAELPAFVRVTSSAAPVPRSAIVAWSRAVLAAGGDHVGVGQGGGAAGVLWALASAASVDGSDELAARRALSDDVGAAASVRSILPWIDALRGRASRRAIDDGAWRGEADLARRAARWIARASEALLEPGACEAALRDEGASIEIARARARREAFYVRAIVHGHHLITDDQPLVGSLRDRAVRVLVARSMERVGAGLDADPAARYPLAIVEAMLRGHGLDSYRSDVEDA